MKYNPELERVTKKWIEEVLGTPFPPNESLIGLLKPGVVLCKLINALNLCNVTVPKIYEVRSFSFILCRMIPFNFEWKKKKGSHSISTNGKHWAIQTSMRKGEYHLMFPFATTVVDQFVYDYWFLVGSQSNRSLRHCGLVRRKEHQHGVVSYSRICKVCPKARRLQGSYHWKCQGLIKSILVYFSPVTNPQLSPLNISTIRQGISSQKH